MAMSKISQLDAINTMLSGIGQNPVDIADLSEPTSSDVNTALQVLNEISKDLQIDGWHFNSDYNWPLTPNGDKLISLPDDVIRVDYPDGSNKADLCIRGIYLYDKSRNSFTFDNTIYVNITRYFDWDSVPESAKRYIVLKATRVFQNRVLGSDALASEQTKDEKEAWAKFLQYELDTGGYNMIDDYPSIVAQRRSFYS